MEEFIGHCDCTNHSHPDHVFTSSTHTSSTVISPACNVMTALKYTPTYRKPSNTHTHVMFCPLCFPLGVAVKDVPALVEWARSLLALRQLDGALEVATAALSIGLPWQQLKLHHVSLSLWCPAGAFVVIHQNIIWSCPQVFLLLRCHWSLCLVKFCARSQVCTHYPSPIHFKTR